MPKAKLDHVFALTAQCEEGKKKTDWYDQTVTGFVLECRSTGGRTYYLRYEDAAGRQKQHKIGRYEDITFAAAKKTAQKLRSEVVMGGDPGAAKAAVKAVPVYADLAAQHLSDAKLTQRSYDTTDGYMRLHILPKWGKMRIADIDGRAVASWLAAKRAEGLAPATVVKLKAIMGRSFALGAQWGIPGCERNPCSGVRLPPLNNSRQVYLDADQAGRLLAAAAKTKNPQLPAILELLLLTGMRVSELLASRWQDLDVERRTLFVPTSKSGRARHVPLSRAALDVIGTLSRLDGATFLFPNPRNSSRHLTTIKHAFQSARKAAGLDKLHLHDLRHSAASAMVGAGIDLYAVGKVLGHANVSSTARYSHLANDTLLAAVDAGAARLNLSSATSM
ncbi:site-specific integrase [Sphingomonas faeni]|uniref:site-specific integrase n=1 Tax=Sphingomonas faeni TaxID=185950 RepID=UPI003355E850